MSQLSIDVSLGYYSPRRTSISKNGSFLGSPQNQFRSTLEPIQSRITIQNQEKLGGSMQLIDDLEATQFRKLLNLQQDVQVNESLVLKSWQFPEDQIRISKDRPSPVHPYVDVCLCFQVLHHQAGQTHKANDFEYKNIIPQALKCDANPVNTKVFMSTQNDSPNMYNNEYQATDKMQMTYNDQIQSTTKFQEPTLYISVYCSVQTRMTLSYQFGQKKIQQQTFKIIQSPKKYQPQQIQSPIQARLLKMNTQSLINSRQHSYQERVDILKIKMQELTIKQTNIKLKSVKDLIKRKDQYNTTMSRIEFQKIANKYVSNRQKLAVYVDTLGSNWMRILYCCLLFDKFRDILERE